MGIMGCVKISRQEDDDELAELRSSVRREDLAKLPEKQLRRRLRELGSKLDLYKSELLDWVLFRNALTIIFGDDDSKVGAALKAVRELQLDRESVTAALMVLRPSRSQEGKDEYRAWCNQMELEEARTMLRNMLLRRTMLRSARAFLHFGGGNLLLQAIMREWRGICTSSSGADPWRYAATMDTEDTDFDIGDEGPRMMGEGREEILGRRNSRDRSNAIDGERLPMPENPVFSVPEGEPEASPVPQNAATDDLQGEKEEPEAPLSAADVVLADEDPSRSSAQSNFDDLDAEMNRVLEAPLFDTLTARLSSQKRSQNPGQITNFFQAPSSPKPMTNFMQG